VVKDHENRKSAPAAYSVLSRLTEVVVAGLGGCRGIPLDLEFSNDVVVEQIIESSGHRVAPREAST